MAYSDLQGKRARDLSLKAAVGLPWLMIADVWIAQRLYPGFNAGAQFISELGAAAAPHPWVFNGGMLLAGAVGLLAGHGFAEALEAAGGRRQVAAFAGLSVAMTGLGGAFAGLFHWPDEMHRACGIGLAIQVAPLFCAWSLWGVPAHRRLVWFSVLWSAVLLVMFMLLAGVWNVRTGHDVGSWQRWYSALCLLWLAIAAWCLVRGTEAEAQASPLPAAAEAGA